MQRIRIVVKRTRLASLAAAVHAPVVIVRIFVEANWGFYGFLLATMVSIILSHIILGCHRYAEEPFHVSTHA